MVLSVDGENFRIEFLNLTTNFDRQGNLYSILNESDLIQFVTISNHSFEFMTLDYATSKLFDL